MAPAFPEFQGTGSKTQKEAPLVEMLGECWKCLAVRGLPSARWCPYRWMPLGRDYR